MYTAILVATALWHLAATWHFVAYPHRTLARTTEERPINTTAAELFRFLGGMNLALVVLALSTLALPAGHRWPAFAALAVANATQFGQDLRVKGLGMARGPFFVQILVGDAIFTVANGVACVTELV